MQVVVRQCEKLKISMRLCFTNCMVVPRASKRPDADFQELSFIVPMSDEDLYMQMQVPRHVPTFKNNDWGKHLHPRDHGTTSSMAGEEQAAAATAASAAAAAATPGAAPAESRRKERMWASPSFSLFLPLSLGVAGFEHIHHIAVVFGCCASRAWHCKQARKACSYFQRC